MVKIKYIDGLLNILQGLTTATTNVANNSFSNIPNKSLALSNLGVYSSVQVDAILGGLIEGRSFETLAEFQASTAWKTMQRAFVKNDGDGKWAIYMSTASVSSNMTYAQANFLKIGDQDSIFNSITASAVLNALEMNGSGQNAVVGMIKAERDKLALLSLTSGIDLDDVATQLETFSNYITSNDDAFLIMSANFNTVLEQFGLIVPAVTSLQARVELKFIDYPKLTENGVQDFEIPDGKIAKYVLLNGSLQVPSTENNTDRTDTYNQTTNIVTLTEITEINNYISIYYQ